MSSSQTVVDRMGGHYDFLKKLSKTSSERKRTRMVRHASDAQLLALVEIALNLLRSNFSLTNRQKSKIVPFADDVRKLSRSRAPHSARQILQKGGGPMIAALLTPIIVELGRYLLSKNG